MKFFFGLFLFLSVLGDGFNKASRTNKTVQEAKRFFENGHYPKAISLYNFLYDSLGVKDKQLLVNLAHAHYLNGNLKKAQRSYNNLSKSPSTVTQSVALTQLGLIYFLQENPERALYNFKKAIIQNTYNNVARYNYELVQKHLATSPSPVHPQNKDSGQNPEEKSRTENNSPGSAAKPNESGNAGTTNDLQNSGNNQPDNLPQGNGLGNKGEAGDLNQINQQPSLGTNNQINAGDTGNDSKGLADDSGNIGNTNKNGETETANGAENELQTLKARLRNTNLTPEKAKMLLEAMRQAELQYLQQLPAKKSQKTKKSLPDW